MPRGIPKQKQFAATFVSKSALPAHVRFATSLSRQGYWEQQANTLRGDPDKCLKLRRGDASSLMQIRAKAKKTNLILLFAEDGDFVYVSAFLPDENQSRLYLLLREPRTLDELRAKRIELNVEQELQRLLARGHAEFRKSKWQLTAKGISDLIERTGAASEGARTAGV